MAWRENYALGLDQDIIEWSTDNDKCRILPESWQAIISLIWESPHEQHNQLTIFAK